MRSNQAGAGKLPELPEPDDYGTMLCEDCSGAGEVGDEIYQGEFQPPEREQCTSCSGSGRWKTNLFRSDTVRAYAQSALDQAGGSKPAEGWQPIETAPHSVDILMVWRPVDHEARGFHREIVVGRIGYAYQPHGWVNGREYDIATHLTHWMPIPAAPKEPT